MKSNLKIIIVSLTCSIISVLFYSIFLNNSTVKEENNILTYNNDYFKSFVNTSGLNNNQSSSNFGSPDLTFAAKKSINAVVHVKNTSIVKEND